MRVGTAFVCLGIDSDAFWRIQPHERTRACVSKYERLTCVSKYERFFLRRNVLQDIDHPQTTQVTSCCEILRVWSQLCSILQLHL